VMIAVRHLPSMFETMRALDTGVSRWWQTESKFNDLEVEIDEFG
jgi:hypothetical protein